MISFTDLRWIMKKIQKFAVCMSVITLLGVSVSGAVTLPFISNTTVVHADSRYVIMTRTLSAQQTRDWASSIRMAGGINKGASAALSTLFKFIGNPVLAAGATVAGFCKPAYLQTVLNAADRGRGVKLIITDSASYHTSYSVQYEIRTI